MNEEMLEMLKKKYFTYRWLVLVASFASLIFSGCGGDETDEVATEVPQEAETDTPEVEAETVEDEPTDEPTTEEPETPSEEPSGDPPEGPEPEPDDPPTNGEIPESLCLSPVTEAGDITTPESKSGNTNPGGGDDHGIEGGGDGSIAGGSTENLVMVFTSRQITLPLTITDSLSDTEIFIAQSQFGSAIPLTDNSWADMDPNLSQDLKYITFASDGGNGNIDIYFAELVKIDGRAPPDYSNPPHHIP
jgi:hypothetical protein